MRGRLVRRVWQHNPALDSPPRYRRACEYEAFVPDLLEGLSIELPGAVAAAASEAEAAIAALNSAARPELAPFARLLLRTESIASSKVEGLQIDARTLARAEVAQDTGRSVGREVAEVLANIDSMQFAIERAAETPAIAPSELLAIQRVLLQRSPNPSVAGKVRTSQNWIGGNDYNPCGAEFVPPPPEEVASLLEDLCVFSTGDDLSPLVQAAIAHAQFETIHPFADGNGRTGRALVQVMLRRRGLAAHFVPPISVVLAKERDAYIRGLTLFREDRVADWIEMFATAAARAAEIAQRYAERVVTLQQEWRRWLRDAVSPRADAAAWAIINVLPAHPLITLPVAIAATKRSKPAVNSAIAELVQANVLLPLTESRRNRAWEAAGMLDLIVGLESGLE